MAELLELSANIIDDNDRSKVDRHNPTDARVHELAPGIAMVTGFSHILSFATQGGLLLFDTSGQAYATRMRDALRRWRDDAVDSVVYTHGHADHVGGMQVFVEEAADRGRARPRIIGHRNVVPRFERYQLTHGYNATINARQFSPARKVASSDLVDFAAPAGKQRRFGPRHWHAPDTRFDDRLGLSVGGLALELRHDRGETDDHAWAWIPEHKAICSGDLFIWVFPNAGNPPEGAALSARMGHGAARDGRPGARAAIAGPRPADRWSRANRQGAWRHRAGTRALARAHPAHDERGRHTRSILGAVRMPVDLLDRPICSPSTTSPSSCAISGGCAAAGMTAIRRA
ncbi:MAG: MBL fold metallo-hydrolase [Burkholderiaceae bacterium]